MESSIEDPVLEVSWLASAVAVGWMVWRCSCSAVGAVGAFAVLLFLQARDLDDEAICWWLGTNCVIIMILRLIYGG